MTLMPICFNFRLKSLLLLCGFFIYMVNQIQAQEPMPYFNYIISKSDKSLWSISQKYHLEVEEIKNLNPKKNNKIRHGEVIKIPKLPAKPKDYVIHLVGRKDKNLWQISLRYKVAVNKIMAINRMKSTNIKIGQELKIPQIGNFLIHTVSKEDKNLWRICQIYDVEVEEVQKCNNKKTVLIQLGDRLIIPRGHHYIPFTNGDLRVNKIDKSSIRYEERQSPFSSIAFLQTDKLAIEVCHNDSDPFIALQGDTLYLEGRYVHQSLGTQIQKKICEVSTYKFYTLNLNNMQKWFVMQTTTCRDQANNAFIHLYYLINLNSSKKSLKCVHSYAYTSPFADRNLDGNLDVEIQDYFGYRIIKEMPSD